MKRMILALMLLTAPVFAQEKPAADTTPAPTAQTIATSPAPTAPAKDPNDWKRPLHDIKFREF